MHWIQVYAVSFIQYKCFKSVYILMNMLKMILHTYEHIGNLGGWLRANAIFLKIALFLSRFSLAYLV